MLSLLLSLRPREQEAATLGHDLRVDLYSLQFVLYGGEEGGEGREVVGREREEIATDFHWPVVKGREHQSGRHFRV